MLKEDRHFRRLRRRGQQGVFAEILLYLKQYLKDHKITRSQFAESIGVSIYDVNNWFSRKPKRFPVDTAVTISSVYHINLDDLIGGEAASKWLFDSIIGTRIETENEARVVQILDTLNDQGAEKFICRAGRVKQWRWWLQSHATGEKLRSLQN